MMEFGACPQCKLDIAPERKIKQPVVCNHCGFTTSRNEEVRREIDKRSIIGMAGASILLLAAYIQVMNWDSAWLSIIPLSLKQTVGFVSANDIERHAEICFNLKKYDCVEEQYTRAAGLDPAKWERTAHFEMQRAKYGQAAQSYYKYFQSGGQNLESQYNYAKALAELGQVDDATKYFDQVLAAKPDVLQVTVIHNYVKLLMNHRRFDQARALIVKVRKDGGESAGSFMDEEFKKIGQYATASRN